MLKHDLKAEELIRRTEALTKEQMELILEHIPVDLCLARVSKELAKNKKFIDSVQSAMTKV